MTSRNDTTDPRNSSVGYTAEEARQRARADYATGDDVQIDDDATVSEADGGAWVAAWVWVPQDDDE